MLIIDAYNALHRSEALPTDVPDVGARGLCRLLHLAGFDRGLTTVVADGSPKPDDDPSIDIGGIDLIFAGPGKDADSVIEELIEQSTSPRSVTVVSNDRRLIRAARRRRCRSMSSEAFMRRLATRIRRVISDRRTADRNPVDLPTDAEYWIRQMGLDDTPAGDEPPDAEIDRWMQEFGFDDDD